jgi:2-dehydro-3-deoxygluconokinase
MSIVCAGECMLELSGGVGASARLALGGDTFNTALYLARLGLAPSYLTGLGTDPYSDAMLADWRAEGVGTELVVRVPDRLPGLYAVHTSAEGERRFYYWRRESAARALFRSPECDRVLALASGADLLYLSGITLSLYEPAERTRLVQLAESVRARGGEVAFDPNYRPVGWRSAKEASAALSEIAPFLTIVLPTLEDEQVLWSDDDAHAAALRWQAWGVREVIVKQGSHGAWVLTTELETDVPVPMAIRPVDTTAAGDAFNAGYLASRVRHRPVLEAVRFAHELAGIVVQHPGAIVPRHATTALVATFATP